MSGCNIGIYTNPDSLYVGIGTTLPSATLDINGTIKTTNLQIGSTTNAFIPAGGIIMWYGSVVTIPTGWALCDGTNGTPDLRDRFLVGAGNSYAVAATGGNASTTLTVANLPNHTHTGTTTTAGTHSHTINAQAFQIGTGAYQTMFGTGGSRTTNSAGDHSHAFTTTDTTDATSTPFTNLPPYYALAFIMKL